MTLDRHQAPVVVGIMHLARGRWWRRAKKQECAEKDALH
jgi:hypothetical protein